MNVYQKYGSELRVGAVVDEKTDSSGWKHYKIQWAGDDKYEASTRWKEHLRNVDNGTFYQYWYRCDEVSPLNVDELQKKLNFFLDNSGKTR
tara:strand:- start:264 stop:536 length:273 start_codon:yes stop_codon:yes gene_type:complete